LAVTLFLSASTLTTDNLGAIGSTFPPSFDEMLTMDLGRNSPTSDRVDLFMPLPIFRSIIEADDAVDDTDRLSVELLKNRPW
jgi:hypothetical protein